VCSTGNLKVTGSTSGIGAETAIQAAREGARAVVVSGRREERGAQVVAEITALGVTASFCKCDVASEEQIEQLVRYVVDTYGRIDCAFNNAGRVSGMLVV
jgi:NAD(P)-dependent dehydrogenase (short-subunit alcohol dehydrogenase family)